MSIRTISNETYFMTIYDDPFNLRLRVDEVRGDIKKALTFAEKIVFEKQYEKMIVYIKMEQIDHCFEFGLQMEGMIDHFFLGSHAYIMTKYYKNDRKISKYWTEEDEIIQEVRKKERAVPMKLGNDYDLRKANINDATELAQLFRDVFEIYPTPMHERDYIVEQMNQGTIFAVVTFRDKIVSCASAEINQSYKNAEITDCLTVPSMRKLGLLKHIIAFLENELRKNQIFCSYSLARALSFGMNASLHQLGYQYRGRLVNNCFIFDKLENMNIWVKPLYTAENLA